MNRTLNPKTKVHDTVVGKRTFPMNCCRVARKSRNAATDSLPRETAKTSAHINNIEKSASG
jgi:hypothetical protein